jgi:hypothetical protein
MKQKGFYHGEKPGFQITFENGWTVSVQWHSGAYCDNKVYIQNIEGIPESNNCLNAEIAAWNSEGAWYDFGIDEVRGYQTPEQVADFIQEVKNFPTK